MAERGFLWCQYVDDASTTWSLAVEEDYAAMPERGWSAAGTAGPPPLPRGWLPRKVFGFDATGRRQTAVVATVIAALWTGVVSSFAIRASDGDLVEVVVTGRFAEDSSRRP